ncbi:uroporphyrinogen decarboxylase [bacterium]|nr:uroporphyrinogen decarboxylase [bacterium]
MSDSLFINACYNKNTARPPIWFMRQAGRYLPEYQALRSNYSFLEMVHTPSLACEVTLQPITRFGFDAAILYSDILVISEAFQLHFDFIEGKGPQLRESQLSVAEIATSLAKQPDVETLSYVYDAIKLLKPELKETPLIGFSGSPFTVACYLIEKQSSKTFSNIHSLINSDPDLLHTILDRLTAVTITHLSNQIKAGVNAVQLFDTWGSILSGTLYHDFSLAYMQKIVSAISAYNIPIIIYSKDTKHKIKSLASLNCNVISVDWDTPISSLITHYPTLAWQGNLNPHTLLKSLPDSLKETKLICDSMKESQGFIFNLGHGILPKTPLDHVKAVVDYVKG